MTKPKLIQWNHSQSDLIWLEGPLMGQQHEIIFFCSFQPIQNKPPFDFFEILFLKLSGIFECTNVFLRILNSFKFIRKMSRMRVPVSALGECTE